MPDSTELPPSPPAARRSPFVDPASPPARDAGFGSRRLPGIAAGEARGMLPGMAMIAMFMLLVAIIGVFGVLQEKVPPSARYVLLPICTLVVVGVFGLLRLRRWGWALVLAGCLLSSVGYFYKSRSTHNPGLLVMAGLTLCFFLYLSRTEVRERLR